MSIASCQLSYINTQAVFIPNGADGRIRTCDELSLRVYKTRALGQLCDISIMGCGRKLRVKDPQPQHLVLACLLQAYDSIKR